jgi:hypothetical protein
MLLDRAVINSGPLVALALAGRLDLLPALFACYSTVTDFARFLGLWLRPALRALTSLREVSLRRKPRSLARLRRRGFAAQARARHSTVTLLARLRGLSTSVPRAHAV